MATTEMYQPDYEPAAQPHLELVASPGDMGEVPPEPRMPREEIRALVLNSCIERVRDNSLKPEEAASIINGYDPDHPVTVRQIDSLTHKR